MQQRSCDGQEWVHTGHEMATQHRRAPKHDSQVETDKSTANKFRVEDGQNLFRLPWLGCTIAIVSPYKYFANFKRFRSSRKIRTSCVETKYFRSVPSRRWPKSFLATQDRVHSGRGVRTRARLQTPNASGRVGKFEHCVKHNIFLSLGFIMDCN